MRISDWSSDVCSSDLLSKEAREKAQGELRKLKSMAPMSAEATVSRNYLDTMLSLPWGKKSKVKKDITAAQKILDEDHYRSEEHTSELQSLMRISYAVFSLKKKKTK